MNLIQVCAVALLGIVNAPEVPGVGAGLEVRDRLETAIPEAIRLLEKKEYATFLKLFVHPDDFKRITEKGSLEEFAAKFGENKSERMLKALQAVKDLKPTLTDDGNTATYEFPERIDGKKLITWVKVEKHWYIQDRPK